MKFNNTAEAKKEFVRITNEFEEWIDAAKDLGLAPVTLVYLAGESLDLETVALGSRMEVAQMLAAALANVISDMAEEQAKKTLR